MQVYTACKVATLIMVWQPISTKHLVDLKHNLTHHLLQQHHVSSIIFKHHQATSSIIKSHQTSSSVIKCHQALFGLLIANAIPSHSQVSIVHFKGKIKTLCRFGWHHLSKKLNITSPKMMHKSDELAKIIRIHLPLPEAQIVKYLWIMHTS